MPAALTNTRVESPPYQRHSHQRRAPFAYSCRIRGRPAHHPPNHHHAQETNHPHPSHLPHPPRHARQHPHRGAARLRGRGRGRAQDLALPARPVAGPAVGVEGQGRAGSPAAGRALGADLHPGDDPPPLPGGGPARGRAPRRAGPVDHVRRPVRRPGLRPARRLLPSRPAMDQPHDPGRLVAGDDLAGREGGVEGAGADDLPGPALRHQVRLQLAGEHPQARRQGRQGRGRHPPAGAGARLPRHLATGHPLLPGLPARPVRSGARVAHGHR